MPTYKQSIKEISRRLLWEKAIKSLTTERNEDRILDERYIRRLWDYCFDDHLLKYGIVKQVDETFLNSWVDFAKHCYGQKLAKDLRVAYLCGPEPENDLKLLLSYGLRIENVWAFESDDNLYYDALKSIKRKYPTLKIFHGSIDSFFQAFPTTFDIIYLDLTSSLLSRKVFSIIHSVFDYQVLSELGILITNSCVPDKTSEGVEVLERYFMRQPFVEGPVFGNRTPKGESVTWFVEDADCHGFDDNELSRLIDINWEHAYSAFVSQYPILYANFVQPSYRVLRTVATRRRIFSKEAFTAKESEPARHTLWQFLSSLKGVKNKIADQWLAYYSEKVMGITRLEAVMLSELLTSEDETLSKMISLSLLASLPKIYAALPDPNGRLFCDVPQWHLWSRMALNQLGFPYHSKIDKHWRCQYVAKKRKMMVDVFAFDRCRAFYDWLPMIEFYGEDLAIPERQIIARSCLDAVGKQSRWVINKLYFGSALIGSNEKIWSDFAGLPPRIDLNKDCSEYGTLET